MFFGRLITVKERTLQIPGVHKHLGTVIDDAEEEDDHLDDDDETAEPYLDEEGHLLATEDIMSDVDDDLATDDEDYHSALVGYREARDLLKEARVARGFYPVVVPIRPEKEKPRWARSAMRLRDSMSSWSSERVISSGT